jgi:hypothetical protein
LEIRQNFFCPCPVTAKEKDRAAKLEALVREGINEMNKASKTYTELIVENRSFRGFFDYLKEDSSAEIL